MDLLELKSNFTDFCIAYEDHLNPGHHEEDPADLLADLIADVLQLGYADDLVPEEVADLALIKLDERELPAAGPDE